MKQLKIEKIHKDILCDLRAREMAQEAGKLILPGWGWWRVGSQGSLQDGHRLKN
jgi:hypothetical protein